MKKQTEGWELFDASVTSCQKSVEKSEQILRNGARALWISFQNPPVSLLSQSEWFLVPVLTNFISIAMYMYIYIYTYIYIYIHTYIYVYDLESPKHGSCTIFDDPMF